ncbi:MAG: phosphate acyltransferase PlsX [Chloroflexi bacterium]|nr:phosphate acyltransferase PlsX [Chloroflexota bacterium]
MTIAVDAMGGDYAPQEVVKGALEASKDFNVNIALVGRQEAILEEVKRLKMARDAHFYIIDSREVIDFGESPARAIKEKPDSSIVQSIDLLKRGEASAFVSAGHTGAVVCASLFDLGLEEGIERPAIGTLFPTPTGHVLLVDAGANVDCRAPFLVQFAHLGVRYMQRVMAVANPRVGLLSNGEEESKGNRLVRETHALLKECGLNFVGNVEGKDLPRGLADVVVTDGFTGNVVLKASEGFAEMLTLSLQHAINGHGHFKKATHLMKSIFETMVKRLDYNERGGAPLLGVRGNVIIAHGRSHAKAIKSAIRLAKQTVQPESAAEPPPARPSKRARNHKKELTVASSQ